MAFASYRDAATALRRYLNDTPQLNELDEDFEAMAVQERFCESPLHVIVSSGRDDVPSWLNVGRTLQRLLNRAAGLGLVHDIAAAPTEVPTLVPRVRQFAPPDSRPQIVLRIGMSARRDLAPVRTRRRPLDDFSM